MDNGKSKYRKPNLLVYEASWVIFRFITKFKINAKCVKNELKGVKGPCVVMVNHTSNYDQCCMSRVTPKRMTYVIEHTLFHTVKEAWVYRCYRTINKKQFRTNIQDVRNMKQVVSNGGMLLIFPTGVYSNCGKETELPLATGKFLKMMGVDVYVVKLNGMCLTKPKWSDILRKGAVEIEASKLLSAEEIKTMKAEEIFKTAEKAMTFDDYEWQEKAKIKYKNGSNLIGLQTVLHSCPVCKAIKSIDVKDENIIYCKNCGFEEWADDYCFLHNDKQPDREIRHISDWSRMITRNLMELIETNENYKFVIGVNVTKLNEKIRGFDSLGKAVLTLDRERLIIESEKGEVMYSEPSDSFASIPNLPGEYFDLQDDSQVLRVYPEDSMDAMLFVDLIDAIYKLKNKVTGEV